MVEADLEEYLQRMPSGDRYFLDYVVPPEVYPTFKPAFLKRGTLPLVGTVHVRVVTAGATGQTTVHALPQMRGVHCFGRGVGFITHMRRI